MAKIQKDHFPPNCFDVISFSDMVARSGATDSIITLTLDVSSETGTHTGGGDPTIPGWILEQLQTHSSRKWTADRIRFEVGNEVYDPRQGEDANNSEKH